VRLGWFLIVFGLMVAAASAVPFAYDFLSSGDLTINPVGSMILMVLGVLMGLLTAAFGGSLLFKSRTGKWPLGF
jgi:small neutral amino acid transporter SnatA (MarC family)